MTKLTSERFEEMVKDYIEEMFDELTADMKILDYIMLLKKQKIWVSLKHLVYVM